MAVDRARLESLIGLDADVSNQHRVRTVLEYLDLEERDRVLDCGCGLGWFLKVAGDVCHCRLHGIDADASRLAASVRHAGKHATLAVASAGALPFPDATFDKIVLTEVLEHVADDGAVLAEVRRVLKPGGVLALTVPNARYPFWWDPVNRCRELLGMAPIRDGFFGGIWTNHLRLYRRGELLDLLARSGFVVTTAHNLVRHSLPFAHNLVYGFGKWAVDTGLMPRADRFQVVSRPPSWAHPLRWALAGAKFVDRRNRRLPNDVEPSVTIALRATRRE